MAPALRPIVVRNERQGLALVERLPALQTHADVRTGEGQRTLLSSENFATFRSTVRCVAVRTDSPLPRRMGLCRLTATVASKRHCSCFHPLRLADKLRIVNYFFGSNSRAVSSSAFTTAPASSELTLRTPEKGTAPDGVLDGFVRPAPLIREDLGTQGCPPKKQITLSRTSMTSSPTWDSERTAYASHSATRSFADTT